MSTLGLPLLFALFVPIAIATNTPVPIPFDPVLLAAAAGRGPAVAIALAVIGAVCAGVGARIELALLQRAAVALRRRAGRLGHVAHAWFYVAVFAIAVLPVPFTVIRLALLEVQAGPTRYAVTVAGGRLLRYLVMVLVLGAVAPPAWVAPTLMVVATSVAVIRFAARRARSEYPGQPSRAVSS